MYQSALYDGRSVGWTCSNATVEIEFYDSFSLNCYKFVEFWNLLFSSGSPLVYCAGGSCH